MKISEELTKFDLCYMILARAPAARRKPIMAESWPNRIRKWYKRLFLNLKKHIISEKNHLFNPHKTK